MPVTVDTLRNIGADVNRFTLTNDGTVQRQGLFHRFMSLFKSSSATAKNAQTLAAIRTAIQNDQRFFAQDVQQQATTLLDGLAGKVVTAAKVREILTTLDGMSTPAKRFNAAVSITAGHLASRGIPDFAQGFGKSYTILAKDTIGKHEPPEGFGHMDYGAKLDDFEARMSELFTLVGDQPGDREVFGKVCLSTLQRSNKSGLKDQDACKAAVTALKANLDECRAIGQAFGAATQRNAVDMVTAMGKPLAPNTLTQLVTCGRSVPKCGIDTLDANSSADDIHKSLLAFLKAARSIDLTAMQFDDDGNVAVAVQDIVTRSAINSLSDAQKRSLLAAIESDACRNLHAFYNKYAMESSQAYNLVSSLTLVAEELKTSLGLPNPTELVIPENHDPATIPPSASDIFSMESIVSGSASKMISGFFTEFKPEDPDEETVVAFRKKTNEIATAQQVANIPSQIAKQLVTVVNGEKAMNFTTLNTSFDKDLDRTLHISLPNGKSISHENREQARDLLTQFVTDDDGATFDSASDAVKTKVHILMSSMNQSMPGIAMQSCTEAADTKSASTHFLGLGDPKPGDNNYTITKDASGNITIHGSCLRQLERMATSNSSSPKPTKLGEGSYEHTEITVTFSAKNLDDMASADWTKYDHAPVQAAESNRASLTRRADAAALVPDGYKFTGTVDVHIHYHVIN